MSLELSLEDIVNILCDGALLGPESNMPSKLITALETERALLEELEDMDFDDCAGGACKL